MTLQASPNETSWTLSSAPTAARSGSPLLVPIELMGYSSRRVLSLPLVPWLPKRTGTSFPDPEETMSLATSLRWATRRVIRYGAMTCVSS